MNVIETTNPPSAIRVGVALPVMPPGWEAAQEAEQAEARDKEAKEAKAQFESMYPEAAAVCKARYAAREQLRIAEQAQAAIRAQEAIKVKVLPALPQDCAEPRRSDKS